MSTATQTLNPASVTLARHRLLTGSVVRLFGADFAAMCSFYLLLSAVPLYAADRGIGAAGAGITTGVLMFASVAAEIAAPAASARIGHRRLLLVGLVLLGVPAMAMPAVSSLAALMAVCAVRGAGFALVVVAVGALAATVLPADRRGEGLGMLGVVAMMPAVVTLPAGVWLVKVAGYPAVFIAAAVAALVAVLPVSQLPADHGTDPASKTRGGGLLGCLRRPALARPTLMFAATAVAGGVVVAFLPIAVDHAVAVPALFVQNITATLARWLAGRYGDRHGPTTMLVPSLLLTAAGMAASALTSSPAAVLVGMALFGTGFGLAQAATLNTMLARVSSEDYGAVSATWNAAYDLGWGTGAIALGVVAAVAGYPIAFAAAALIAFAALPLARRGRR
jgi:predicted MFS family arabinose efflux permease